MKQCRQCKEHKDLSAFCNNKNNEDGLQKRCRACNKVNAKKYYKDNPEQRRIGQLRRKYGVEPEHYELMYKRCGGKCELCGAEEANIPNKRLCVDHNHETNEVRGLLCMSCNAGLGSLGDSVERLTKAITYLEERGSYG